jgi:hypothetical protein
LLLSRRHDVVRVWNASAAGVRYTAGADGRGIIHIVNFAGRQSGHPMSIWVAKPYRSARLRSLDSQQPRAIEMIAREGGTEVHVPAFSIYAAIELGA